MTVPSSRAGQELSKDLQNPAQQELVKASHAMRIQAAMVQAAQHRDQQNDVYQKTASDVRVKTAQEARRWRTTRSPTAPLATFDHDNPAANSQYQQYLQTIKSETRDQAAAHGPARGRGADLVEERVAKAYALTLGHLIDRKGGAPGRPEGGANSSSTGQERAARRAQDKVRALLEAGLKKDKALSLAIEVKGSIGGINAQEKELDALQGRQDRRRRARDGAAAPARGQRPAPRRAGRKRQGDDRAGVGPRAQGRQHHRPVALAARLRQAARPGRAHRPDVQARGRGDFDDSKQYSDLMRMSAEDPAAS
jgi:hypothetical protein